MRYLVHATHAGAGADTDKMISAQLFLDIKEFGKQAAQVTGVNGFCAPQKTRQPPLHVALSDPLSHHSLLWLLLQHGVDPQKSPEFYALWRTVAPEEQANSIELC